MIPTTSIKNPINQEPIKQEPIKQEISKSTNLVKHLINNIINHNNSKKEIKISDNFPIRTDAQSNSWNIFPDIDFHALLTGNSLKDLESKIIIEAIKPIFPQLTPEELDTLTNYILNIPIIKVRLENINKRLITQVETVGLMTLQDIIGVIPELGDAIGAIMDVIYSGRKYKQIYDDIDSIKTEIINKIPHDMDGLKELLKEQAKNAVHDTIKKSIGNSNIHENLNKHIQNASNAAASLHNIHDQASSIQNMVHNSVNNLNPDSFKQLTSDKLTEYTINAATNIKNQTKNVAQLVVDNAVKKPITNNLNNQYDYLQGRIERRLTDKGNDIGIPHKPLSSSGGSNLKRKTTRHNRRKTTRHNRRKTTRHNRSNLRKTKKN